MTAPEALRTERLRLRRRSLNDAPQVVRALDGGSGGDALRSLFARSELICGAAAHDLHHAGQIQFIKRLHEHR